MESKVNYTLVGVFVTALLIVAILIGLWLSAGINTDNYKIYQVFMNESVAGLSDNAPVKYNGVDVGKVDDIELNLKNPQQVILTLKIRPSVPITQSTTAILTEQGITGIAYIGLTAGKKAPLLETQPGQKYPVIPAKPSFLVKLDKTIENLSDKLGDMSSHVKALLSEKNTKAVAASLKNIQKFTDVIAKNSENINTALVDFKEVMKNTAQASRSFPDIMRSIDKGSQSIQAVGKELSATAKNLNKTAEQGSITLQSFSNDILPITYDTMKNIKEMAQNLNSLSAELNQNPSIIIKGKTRAKPGPGE